MEQYINKDILVAEIERLLLECEYNTNSTNPITSGNAFREYSIYNKILSFINTLEVKEVDLEKEIKEQSSKYYSQCEKKLQEMDDNDKDLSFFSLDNFAKHFFELGLKAKKGEEL